MSLQKSNLVLDPTTLQMMDMNTAMGNVHESAPLSTPPQPPSPPSLTRHVNPWSLLDPNTLHTSHPMPHTASLHDARDDGRTDRQAVLDEVMSHLRVLARLGVDEPSTPALLRDIQPRDTLEAAMIVVRRLRDA